MSAPCRMARSRRRLGAARKIGLDRLIGPDGNRCRDLILALAVSRILDPGSKLAASRALSPDAAASSLGAELGLGPVDEEELYTALDWLAVRQAAIETALARRHLIGGTLVLYDVTSSARSPSSATNRDGKKGKLQIVFRLSTACSARPTGVPSPSKCSKATPATRRRWRPRPRRPGRRQGHDRRGADHRGHQAGRARLDHRAVRPGDPQPGGRRRVSDVAVR